MAGESHFCWERNENNRFKDGGMRNTAKVPTS